MRKIIFIQSKLPSDSGALRQIAFRWNKYGDFLQRQDGLGDLWLFTPNSPNGSSKLLSEFKHIKKFSNVESQRSLIKRLLALEEEIRKSDGGATLVCGDNQQSLLIALLLKFRSKSLVRVQIQFHGDTYSFSMNRGLKGFLRILLSRLGIIYSDSIRIVSKFQKKEIEEIWKNSSNKFVLAPIPIEKSKIATSDLIKKYDLAFIGRLHGERGIQELIEITKSLKSIRPKTTIAIAGDGPLQKFVAQEFQKWINESTVCLLGFLNEHDISELYATTKVLVSTAQHEGYGLTLREAILSNVPVIARESNGVLETKATYPDEIFTFQTIEQAVELIFLKLSGVAQPQNPQLLEAQIQSDELAMKKLVNVWLSL